MRPGRCRGGPRHRRARALFSQLLCACWFACREQLTYQVAAIAASAGVIALAVAATYFRFDWHMEESQDIPWVEIAATLTLVAGGAVSRVQGLPRKRLCQVASTAR